MVKLGLTENVSNNLELSTIWNLSLLLPTSSTYYYVVLLLPTSTIFEGTHFTDQLLLLLLLLLLLQLLQLLVREMYHNPHDFINVRNANIDEYVNATLKNITLLGVSRSEKNIGCFLYFLMIKSFEKSILSNLPLLSSLLSSLGVSFDFTTIGSNGCSIRKR